MKAIFTEVESATDSTLCPYCNRMIKKKKYSLSFDRWNEIGDLWNRFKVVSSFSEEEIKALRAYFREEER